MQARGRDVAGEGGEGAGRSHAEPNDSANDHPDDANGDSGAVPVGLFVQSGAHGFGRESAGGLTGLIVADGTA